nr:MAG TPA: hypothetical protein [Bacteriophage sp.]
MLRHEISFLSKKCLTFMCAQNIINVRTDTGGMI